MIKTADKVAGLLAALAVAQPGHAFDCAMIEALDAHPSIAVSPDGATCATYATDASQTGRFCYWDFSYRSDAVARFADVMWQTLTNCRAGQPGGPDSRVNHPDSYNLREWHSARGVYAVSVKDKGAQERSLVFLRFEPLKP